jgi:two-component system cell cycle response regulator DivK
LENDWALVVEDDAHHLLIISSILREMGLLFKRNTTGSGVERLANALQPSIIIIDLDMPGQIPFSISQAVKASPMLCHIPLLAIGGQQWQTALDQVRESGFAGFMSKPLPRKQFMQAVNRILAGQSCWS